MALIAVAVLAHSAEALVLVDEGEPQATIVCSSESGPTIQQAADRLRDAVQAISGVRLPVVETVAEVATASRILIGGDVQNPPDVGEARLGFDGCYVRVRGHELVFLGPRDAGIANGVSWFVEWRLGLHILGFGPNDRIVPREATIEVSDFEHAHRPSFAWRESWTSVVRGEEGYVRVLAEGESRRSSEYYALNRRGGVSLSGAHSLYTYVPDSLFTTHPEFFPLIDGQRRVRSPRDGTVQRELSHPGVLALVVENLRRRYRPEAVAYATVSPNDDAHWSESEADRAMAEAPAARMLRFCNRVVAALEPTHPRLGACFLAYSYSSTMEPPLHQRAHERVVPLVAPLGVCPVHGPRSDVCPDHGEMRRIYAGWKRVADRVTTYPYIYANILPLPTPSTVAEEIRYFHELGLFGVQREHMARGFGWELSYWLEWQLLWDASADVRTLRRVFMDGWYGDAAGPIQRIYDRVEAVVTSVPAGQPMTERDPVRNWRGWFRGWTDSFNQLPESLLATVPANLEDLAEARRLASRPTTRAHVERDAADLAAMAAYARGRVAFDRWEAGSAGQAATLAVLSESIEEAQRWQPVSPRGTHAQIGQLRRLLAAIESETR